MKKSKNLINRWSEYIKLYEDLELKSIPNELKQLTKDIRNIIKDEIVSNKSFNKYLELHGLKINLSINFIKNSNHIYFSDVNIYDLLHKDTIDLKIDIQDNIININDLMSIINHELRHVYDTFTINKDSDMKSFSDLLNLKRFTSREDNKNFKYFTDLIYLSFEHELIARNCMLYDKFIYDGLNKTKIYKLFEDTYTYKALIQLQNFNSVLFISKFELDELERVTKSFKEIMSYEFTNVADFYKNWEMYFKNKSKEYLTEAYKCLDIIIDEKIQEQKIYEIYPSYRDSSINTWNDILKNKKLYEKNIL